MRLAMLNYRGAQIARKGELVTWPLKRGFSDAFNRADGALDASPGWTRIDGTAGTAAIKSNQLISLTAAGEAVRITNQGSANHYVQAAASAYVTSPGMFLACRLADSNNFVGIICSLASGGTEVWRRVAGTYTALMAAAGGAVTVGDTIRLETNGTTWRALKNGVQLGTGAIGDATLTSTQQGVVATSAQDPAWDNFRGGRL